MDAFVIGKRSSRLAPTRSPIPSGSNSAHVLMQICFFVRRPRDEADVSVATISDAVRLARMVVERMERG